MGLLKIISNIDLFKSAKDEAIERALEAIGIDAEKYAKLHLDQEPRRIDTGRLRNSITHATREYNGVDEYSDNDGNVFTGGSARDNPSKSMVVIGTNVEYAPYVEFGHRNGGTIVAPNHFLKSAAADHTDRYKKIAKSYMEDA